MVSPSIEVEVGIRVAQLVHDPRARQEGPFGERLGCENHRHTFGGAVAQHRRSGNKLRRQFLKFVCGRTRLPSLGQRLSPPIKIQPAGGYGDADEDGRLLSASTCFFSLSLPEYSSKELLKEKLLFAINNVTTMETDFQTNSAEIAEGYRAF